MRHLVATVLAIAAPLAAQGFNCQLLGTQNLHPNYNDVWGYVAPNGKEYAILCAQSGTAIIDCSNPATPVERGWFPGPQSTWRDARTYQQYAYVVTEGGAGFQIIDLSNADSPVLLGTFGSAQFGNAHNVCIDTGTGRLYAIGCNTGTPVFDLTANPANPPFLGYALGSGNSNYFHDLCVEGGFGYGSMIYNGQLRIWDVTVWPPATLSNSTTPNAFTHNAWPNDNYTLCVTTDERAGGVIKLFDITNPSSPQPRGQFTPNATSIPHNAYIVGNLVHISWYTEGYQCVDISDPNNPVQVAAYDTWPGASGGFNGAWGCYPFQPSGNIYVSDISTGLYIVRPQITNLAIQHTPVADPLDEVGPYPVRAVVTSNNPLQSVTLTYRVNNAAPTTVAMTPTSNPGEYGFDLPGQIAPTTVSYSITATDSVASRRSPQNGDHSFLVGTLTRALFDDFESDLGWTHGMNATQDDWQRGASGGSSGTSGGVGWADPTGAYSGSNCWGNDLTIGNFNGAYQNNVNNWLQSPSFPTNGVQGLRLRFRRWLTLAFGDQARVIMNGQLVWSTSSATYDTSWQLSDHDVSWILNGAANFYVRYELITNGTVVAGGWTIDDVEVYKLGDAMPAQHYGTGGAGTGSFVPLIDRTAAPRIGSNLDITGSNLLGGAPTVLIASLGQVNIPVYGTTLLVDPGMAVFLPTVSTGSGAGNGTASWPFTVPNDPLLDNLDIYCQIAVRDNGSPGGVYATSDGMRSRICLQ